jgi:hypothetical protein
MKFGKKFEDSKIQEWKTRYLDYKRLKHYISGFVGRNSAKRASWESEFSQLVNSELESVNEFYANILHHFMERNALLHSQLKKLHKTPSDRKRAIIINAYKEHYRGLNLLKKFIHLNELALHKISKKYEKKCGAKIPIFQFDVLILNYMISESENIFVNEFAEGDRKKGLKMFRFSDEVVYDFGSIYRCGLWSGVVVSMLIAILIMYAVLKTSHPDLEKELYAFKVMVFPVLLLLCIALDLRIWSLNQINWRFIFGISTSPKQHLTKWEFTEIALLLVVVWEISLLTHLILVYFDTPYRWIIIVVFIGVVVIWLFQPFNFFYRSSRYWFLGTLGRCLFAPFFEVKFKDFWVADQLISLSEFLFEIQFALCFYQIGTGFCGFITSSGIPLLNVVPYHIRTMQNLRKYWDEGDNLQLINAVKNLISGLAIIFAFVDSILIKSLGTWNFMKIYWLIFITIGSHYKFIWDVYVDWGLFRSIHKHPFLRRNLIFHPFWYYISMVYNLIIRFIWIPLLVINITVQPNEIAGFWMSLLVAALEIFRRFLWNVFRLENEHLTNCEHFRVVREIPLPFEVTTDEQLMS